MSSLIDQTVPGPTRDLIGYGRHAPRVVWPDNAKVAVSLVMNYEEGSEASFPSGDERNEGLGEVPYAMKPGVRDLAMESVFEYGSRAGVWRLMRMFDEFDVKTTFFACGAALERNPEVGPVDPGERPRAVLARLALGGAVAAVARGGARAHPARHRDDRGDVRRAPARLVLPLRAERAHARARRRGGRLHLRLRRLQRRPALLHRGRRSRAPRRPLHARLQRRALHPAAGHGHAERVRRGAHARPRRALARGRGRLSEDDVDRAARPLDRPGGADRAACASSSSTRSRRATCGSPGASTSPSGGSTTTRSSDGQGDLSGALAPAAGPDGGRGARCPDRRGAWRYRGVRERLLPLRLHAAAARVLRRPAPRRRADPVPAQPRRRGARARARDRHRDPHERRDGGHPVRRLDRAGRGSRGGVARAEARGDRRPRPDRADRRSRRAPARARRRRARRRRRAVRRRQGAQDARRRRARQGGLRARTARL